VGHPSICSGSALLTAQLAGRPAAVPRLTSMSAVQGRIDWLGATPGAPGTKAVDENQRCGLVQPLNPTGYDPDPQHGRSAVRFVISRSPVQSRRVAPSK